MITGLPLPHDVELLLSTITLRRAAVDDLDALMILLADDAISTRRGDGNLAQDRSRYLHALEEIVADACNEVVVGVDAEGTVVATFQLTRLVGLSRRGATRLQVEAVRVSSQRRGDGLGSAMLRWVMDEAAPAIGASLVQLTSDAARQDAHRFYERLGMTGSHIGFKLALPVTPPE